LGDSLLDSAGLVAMLTFYPQEMTGSETTIISGISNKNSEYLASSVEALRGSNN
jgi:hypothetical protein